MPDSQLTDTQRPTVWYAVNEDGSGLITRGPEGPGFAHPHAAVDFEIEQVMQQRDAADARLARLRRLRRRIERDETEDVSR